MNQSKSKRGGLSKLFTINSSKSNSIQSSSQFHTSVSSTALTQAVENAPKPASSADNIENIFKKYANKATAPSAVNSQPAARAVNEGILIGILLFYFINEGLKFILRKYTFLVRNK